MQNTADLIEYKRENVFVMFVISFRFSDPATRALPISEYRYIIFIDINHK
jgi:hypothetical protein